MNKTGLNQLDQPLMSSSGFFNQKNQLEQLMRNGKKGGYRDIYFDKPEKTQEESRCENPKCKDPDCDGDCKDKDESKNENKNKSTRKNIRKRGGGHNKVFKGCSSCQGGIFNDVARRYKQASSSERGVLNFLDTLEKTGILGGEFSKEHAKKQLRQASQDENHPLFQFASSVVDAADKGIENLKNIEGIDVRFDTNNFKSLGDSIETATKLKDIVEDAANEIKDRVLRQEDRSGLTPGSVDRLNVKYGGLFQGFDFSVLSNTASEIYEKGGDILQQIKRQFGLSKEVDAQNSRFQAKKKKKIKKGKKGGALFDVMNTATNTIEEIKKTLDYSGGCGCYKTLADQPVDEILRKLGGVRKIKRKGGCDNSQQKPRDPNQDQQNLHHVLKGGMDFIKGILTPTTSHRGYISKPYERQEFIIKLNELMGFEYDRRQCENFYDQHCQSGLLSQTLDMVMDFWANDKDNTVFGIYRIATALLSTCSIINLKYRLLASLDLDQQKSYVIYSKSQRQSEFDEKVNIYFFCTALQQIASAMKCDRDTFTQKFKRNSMVQDLYNSNTMKEFLKVAQDQKDYNRSLDEVKVFRIVEDVIDVAKPYLPAEILDKGSDGIKEIFNVSKAAALHTMKYGEDFFKSAFQRFVGSQFGTMLRTTPFVQITPHILRQGQKLGFLDRGISFMGGCSDVVCNDQNCPKKSQFKVGECVGCEKAEKAKEERLSQEQKKVLSFYGGCPKGYKGRQGKNDNSEKRHAFHISALEDATIGPELTQLLLQQVINDDPDVLFRMHLNQDDLINESNNRVEECDCEEQDCIHTKQANREFWNSKKRFDPESQSQSVTPYDLVVLQQARNIESYVDDAGDILSYVEKYLGEIPLVKKGLEKARQGSDVVHKYVQENMDSVVFDFIHGSKRQAFDMYQGVGSLSNKLQAVVSGISIVTQINNALDRFRYDDMLDDCCGEMTQNLETVLRCINKGDKETADRYILKFERFHIFQNKEFIKLTQTFRHVAQYETVHDVIKNIYSSCSLFGAYEFEATLHAAMDSLADFIIRELRVRITARFIEQFKACVNVIKKEYRIRFRCELKCKDSLYLMALEQLLMTSLQYQQL